MNSKRSNRSKLTLEVSEIIQLYKDGQSTTEIAEKANVSSRYIRHLLNDNSVEMRSRGSWKRKYHLNEDYFKTWSDNMAYILGFILADGNINGNTQSVTISQKHKEILEDIKQELQSDQPIMETKRGLFLFHINSSIIRHDLINLHGLTPNKSLTVEFPEVPEKYLHHFVRGYFDGDGSINYPKYTVTFVGGSVAFMNSLQKELYKVELTSRITEKNNHYRLFISGRKSIKLFANWIYKDSDLYLKRKFLEFEREHLPLEKLKDREKRTKSAVKARKFNFLQEYKRTRSILQSSVIAGIKVSTYTNWLKNDIEFKEEFNKIENKGE
ncbi:intein-encoded DNA endonuclease-like protein [Bacillus tianshenii]|uniref:Intein-encoded DNA endonuclease-like protein n=1 Tax=Sutcliffiella tianshenii TaxID=1463404 RepID=A0ABS2NWW1_9BACI|nr:LAGLIDADG family homing endonuclease [Bacillus tianshenii]MBM7619150.1 intein-encoded DNA endonuclease-like protein [Bacillus tianshenii]